MSAELVSSLLGAGVAVFLAIAEYNRRMLGALHRRFDGFEEELEDIKITLAAHGFWQAGSQSGERRVSK